VYRINMEAFKQNKNYSRFSLRNRSEMLVDLAFAQNVELSILDSDGSNLDLGGFEIDGEDRHEATDCTFDGALVIVCWVFLEFLLQVVVCFVLLHTRTRSFISAEISGRIGFVELRLSFFIDADENHAATERSHLCILSVHLRDISNLSAQHVSRDVISVSVLPL